MSENLFPTFDIPDLTEIQNESDRSSAKSILFDFTTGDFVTDKGGKMIEADETQTWIQWCLKAIYTQRSSVLAYSDNYGSENEEAFAEPTQEARESSFMRTITEALLADPYKRTASVTDFSFSWDVDSVSISFVVTAKSGISEPLNVTL